jgi:hypothetical protein
MNGELIEDVVVDRIRIVNPRTRNKITWLSIVSSIRAVGLKSRSQYHDAIHLIRTGTSTILCAVKGGWRRFAKSDYQQFRPSSPTRANQTNI